MDPEAPPNPGRVLARLARQVELALTTVDLTLPQYRVLGILDRGPEASSVLAEKLAVSRPSVTGVVDGLVARGLARRDHDAADRRRIGIELTDDGRQLLAHADTEVERRLHEIAAHLDDPGSAFAGLGPWLAGLEAHRSARHKARQGAQADTNLKVAG
jgi:DNA-binding MarR family transcriptional regulator